jgi:hypothetical protein
MYSCYIDESGHNGRKFNPNQPVEILCGVITDMTKLFKTQKEFLKIVNDIVKFNFIVKELKASNVYHGRKQWVTVAYQERYEIIKSILLWAKSRKCKFIVCPIDTKKFFDLVHSGNALANKFTYPYEAGAINVILGLERHQNSKRGNKGKTLVIFDEQRDHDDNLVRILQSDLSFTDSYTGYKLKPRSKNNPPRLGQIIDIPYFSPSHLSVIIQLADWAAFIVNRYLLLTVYDFKGFEDELSIIEPWYEIIQGCCISHTCIDPSSKDELCIFYKSLRPNGWSPKDWYVTREKKNN